MHEQTIEYSDQSGLESHNIGLADEKLKTLFKRTGIKKKRKNVWPSSLTQSVEFKLIVYLNYGF